MLPKWSWNLSWISDIYIYICNTMYSIISRSKHKWNCYSNKRFFDNRRVWSETITTDKYMKQTWLNILQHITKYYNILHTINVKQKFPTFLFFLFQLHLSSKWYDCTPTPEQLEVFMIPSSEQGCLSYYHRFGKMNSSIIFYSDFALKSQFLLLVTASHFNLCFFYTIICKLQKHKS